MCYKPCLVGIPLLQITRNLFHLEISSVSLLTSKISLSFAFRLCSRFCLITRNAMINYNSIIFTGSVVLVEWDQNNGLLTILNVLIYWITHNPIQTGVTMTPLSPVSPMSLMWFLVTNSLVTSHPTHCTMGNKIELLPTFGYSENIKTRK